METLNFAFVLHDCLLIGSGNPNFFVCGFKINTPVLQHSNTPCGLSRHSQLSLTPAEDGIFDPPTGRGFKRLNKFVFKLRKKSFVSLESLCCKGPQKNERRFNFLQLVWFRRILLKN